MVRDILVDVSFEERRAAILENDEPVEIFIETAGRIKLIGNIYRGVIDKVLPGMQAAFVDIGTGKNAFLYAGDVIPLDCSGETVKSHERQVKIQDSVKPGQVITVQVIKEPIDTKGARVTRNIALPGRNLVLTPYDTGIGVSKKISDAGERERLKNLAVQFCPDRMGLIVRTVAEGIEACEMEYDIRYLLDLWRSILEKERRGSVPGCLYQEPELVQKLARDYLNQDIRRFILNDRMEFDKLMEFLDAVSPVMKTKVEFFSEDYGLFAFYNVESAIHRALSRKVWLKCGGYVVFDKTEALTVIDVNTGKFTGRDSQEDTILKTNLEAAYLIARQIRLRDISGIILIDFIDMKASSHKNQVLAALSEAVKYDRTKVFVLGMTSLGLVEMTRKKVNNPLRQVLSIACRRGTGGVPAILCRKGYENHIRCTAAFQFVRNRGGRTS